MGSGSMIQACRERNRRKVREWMKKRDLFIGIYVRKSGHENGCMCWSCLTAPGVFCPFPEEHKQFCDTLFSVVAE